MKNVCKNNEQIQSFRKTFIFKDKLYPNFIKDGYHSKYIRPVAQNICKGRGVDIGCKYEKWKLYPDDDLCVGIDKSFNNSFHSLNLPDSNYDYIFSSHCLEHIDDYMKNLRYWKDCLISGGILFLYLPHENCEYWKPWVMKNNKHKHQFYPHQMIEIFKSLKFKNTICSEMDMAFSFAIFGEK